MYSTLIKPQELNLHLNNTGWIIVDCRYDLSDADAGYRAYCASHIPNAVYADLNKDLSDTGLNGCGRHPLPTPAWMEKLFTRLGISNNYQVVAYDAASGSLAARLWWMLRYMGHEQVCIIDGGWQAWIDAGFDVEQVERKNPEAEYKGTPIPGMLVEINQVLVSRLLVDSREPVRFSGVQEPIDPVAGHIPGAVNHYWKKNLDDNGRFLPSVQLNRMFLDVYDGIPANEVVFYCGSGVTACHNVLASVHAGLPGPRLYAGSWSEWCTSPGRPTATGPA